MEYIVSVDSYEDDHQAKHVWERLSAVFMQYDGISYYSHPIISSVSSLPPDFSVLAQGFEPFAIKIIRNALDEIDSTEDAVWTVGEEQIDSPLLEIEDFIVGLESKFERERDLRNAFKPFGCIVFPFINKSDFEDKFGEVQELLSYSRKPIKCVWSDLNFQEIAEETQLPLDARLWDLSKSIFQGISPLNSKSVKTRQDTSRLGGAIKSLEKEIALLDRDQHKVAVQMAPGPQRIRGLAGTGKTVVLAMKAANIHHRYNDRKILFTFNTQSLYNQARYLISKFYRLNSDHDPNWDMIHVRHAWGGRSRPGVYFDTCRRMNLNALDLNAAKRLNRSNPFKACCQHALSYAIEPFYDYILIDEAQDFPKEYFYLLKALIKPTKRIYFAYDELQSLTSVEIPTAEELFGTDEHGNPFISLEGPDYPGGIEKDFVLHKSYRCPMNILMLAHGVGLGIHSPKDCVQMLNNRSSWEAVGYNLNQGELRTGEEVVLCRPAENSPNRIGSIYTGLQEIVSVNSFDERHMEMKFISDSINNDITAEGVKPEQIVVICLDTINAKTHLIALQSMLDDLSIKSSIPGLVDNSWFFGEEGYVTLATVFRAKGNEAPVVYIMCFDALYSYIHEVENRNRAFTSISRAKAFLRISGTGRAMKMAAQEVVSILRDIPCFKFTFPDLDNLPIKKLDASETSRRKREVKQADKVVKQLIDIDTGALAELGSEKIKLLKEKLSEVDSED